MSGNSILMMSNGSMMTVRTGKRPSRKVRKERLSHRSNDRSGAVIVSFDDLYPLFEAAYPWQVRADKKGDFSDREDELTQILQWCAENFGKSDYFMPYVNQYGHSHAHGQRTRNVRATIRARWNHLGWMFYFRSQEDATLFKVCHC